MGIPLTVFSLYRLEGGGEGRPDHLLLRVRQPGFSNADVGEENAAVDVAEARRQAPVAAYAPGATAHLVGELQAHPVGEALDGPGGVEVDLWVARTRYGAPWVVLGTAADEAAFWRGVEEDGDLLDLGPVRPAKRLRAFFLADNNPE
jgi:hypothetical protein